ncbi:phosphoglycerate mutase-like protein [Punctularia strigosozonata HHB-11173 SS5]|uniref:phosphoglycerate mutase-like protein n=1 Tax=Punctularia strigosozonata (strain HHB-11173) TaxID=741275 RepID=UPI0004417D33|nr:phosphoglycerate mutase-like protein [Punctularia strigosozonata HHB-11173 SS5]EIN06643.1 phosphoglycerate mutase-like protein [Punctularia strigosozonata HHB-11173 SS5]
MSHPQVHGVVLLVRNGDRTELYQDPNTYKTGSVETTALGEVQSHLLGSYLRSLYLDSNSPSHIRGLRTDLVDTKQVHVRVKAGGEGTVVFDSAIALLQGLFPPTSNNKIVLANETEVIAPLGGYQYVPLETVEPYNDRSLESWTDCPAFQKHISKVYGSDKFKDMAKAAAPFLRDVKDFVYNTPVTMENMVHDFISSELVHNRSYAHRLPPTFIEQSQHWANLHEAAVFTDKDMAGIGHIASRTILRSILGAFERIVYNGDPLQLYVQEVTYQPIISLLSQTDVLDEHPELAGIPNFASAIAIELRKGDEGDSRDYLRFKFKNGTSHDFQTVSVFGKGGDIALTEFIYRLENSVINNNAEWKSVCGASKLETVYGTSTQAGFVGLSLLLFFIFAFLFARFKRSKARTGYVKLGEPTGFGQAQFVRNVSCRPSCRIP